MESSIQPPTAKSYFSASGQFSIAGHIIHDVGPIMSKLGEQGITSVTYSGELDAKSRYESYMKNKVKMTVATLAFRMGIDK